MSKHPLPIYLTTGSDTAQGWSADDPRNRRHEMKLPDDYTETRGFSYVSRPSGLPVTIAPETESPMELLSTIATGIALFGSIALIMLVVVLDDGIWTDRSTGCRYRESGWGTATPLLLPSGLPDCRVVEVKP